MTDVLRGLRSIRSQLIAIGMITTIASLAVAGVALAVFDYVSYRGTVGKEVASAAGLVAANSTAALAFDDAGAAGEILGALAPQRDVIAACLYDERGALFASYVRPGGPGACPPAPEADGQRQRGDVLVQDTAVLLDGQRIGALRLEASLDSVDARLRLFGLVLALVIAASSAAAFVVAARLQRIVSRPILELADTARRVSERQDYALRAPAPGGGEIGVAVDAFNAMLDRVQGSDRALREAGERSHEQARLLQGIVDNMGEGLVVSGADGRILVWNPAAIRLLGEPPARLDLDELPRRYGLHRSDGLALLAPEELTLARALRDGAVTSLELLVRPPGGGAERWLSSTARPLRDEAGRVAGAIAVLRDVSQQKQAEAELRASEAQLRQAQKMEAIGRLVGGIAHDFNNLLTAILGNSTFALEHLPPGHPARPDVEEAQAAGERAAALTKQLLAFGRKQVLSPQPLDLGAVVAGMESMLRRLIGEHIELVTRCAPGLGAVKVDPGQLSQVILNLAVNARDAMPRGGTLTLETDGVELDERAARAHPGLRPGRYVRLSVSDTGAGMDAETQNRVFEPFFTTKGPGEGTGLGLATVHGIVRQSGGDVSVRSEPGRGACFTVHLPCCDEPAAHAPPATPTPARGGHETVLLVEDSTPVRELARAALVERGYAVLSAGDAEEALRLFEARAGRVDLLVSDVVMPRVSGPELARRLSERAPALRVLFMSGYTAGAITQQGLAAAAFLEKPFLPDALARKVREVLDAGAAPLAGAVRGE